MPSTTRALTRAARRRAESAGVPYQQAHQDVQVIHQIAAEQDLTFAEAEAEYDDPRNQVMCETCGWTWGMVCPECPGCGCYTGRCTGWRHASTADEFPDPAADPDAWCEECGGDFGVYGCNC